jgi:hypothetical protein
MNSARIALRIASPVVIFGTLAAAMIAGPAVTDTAPAPKAPSIAAVPNDLLIAQATAGRTCTTTPSLTDHVLVTDKAGATTELTFDQALAASKTGSTVRLYCN